MEIHTFPDKDVSNADIRKIFGDVKDAYTGLAGASEIQIQEGTEGVPADAVSVVIPDAVLYVPLEDLVDFEKEKERLTKEKEKLEKELPRECFLTRDSCLRLQRRRWLRKEKSLLSMSR